MTFEEKLEEEFRERVEAIEKGLLQVQAETAETLEFWRRRFQRPRRPECMYPPAESEESK